MVIPKASCKRSTPNSPPNRCPQTQSRSYRSLRSRSRCLDKYSRCTEHHQTGTLEGLITLSEDLPKQDAFFTQTVAKIVEILRNLLNNDSSKLAQHILVDEQPVDQYMLDHWQWNGGRYVIHRSVKEIVETLNKVRITHPLFHLEY